MNIEWEPVDNCPVCGGVGVHSISNNDPEIKEDIHVFYCLVCHSSYHNPRMTQKSMVEYYSSGEYRQHSSRKFQPNIEEHKHKAAEMKALMLDSFRRDMNVKVNRSMDYGCSRGYLVKALQKTIGGEVVGFDIYKDPSATIDIVDSKDKLEGKFDVITCTHVLEHMPHPIEELDWMVSMLNPDGLLFIEVPFARLVFPPHPILFSRESIFLLMKHIRARYIFYDMQYVNDNGLIFCQPNHPASHSLMNTGTIGIGYFREGVYEET